TVAFRGACVDYERGPLVVESDLLHRCRSLRRTVHLRRFPKFDPISFEITNPPEATVRGVLDLSIDGDPLPPERREHQVQVLHAVIDHEGRAVLTEVLRVSGEDRPDRCSFLLALLSALPGEEDHRVLDVHPQVTAIPLG